MGRHLHSSRLAVSVPRLTPRHRSTFAASHIRMKYSYTRMTFSYKIKGLVRRHFSEPPRPTPMVGIGVRVPNLPLSAYSSAPGRAHKLQPPTAPPNIFRQSGPALEGHTKRSAGSRSTPIAPGSVRWQPLGAGPAPLMPPARLAAARHRAPPPKPCVGGRTEPTGLHPGTRSSSPSNDKV